LTWHDYQLEDTVLAVSDDATLWQTEKGLVKINKNTLALPIQLNGRRRGYVFHGQGQLTLDTIVETEEGAVGRPVDTKLTNPFLMLGAEEESYQRFGPASAEDLRHAGYEHSQQFITEAQTLCERFFDRGAYCSHGRFGEDRGVLFVFSNGTPKMDILLAKDSELVYKKAGFVFVSNRDNSILKGHGMVILSRSGRSFVVNQ
jgi:hypothetical protein